MEFLIRIDRFVGLILVHFGALPFWVLSLQNKKPCKSLTYKALCYEGEGARTLNLRIDSPKRGFVSPVLTRVYRGKNQGMQANRSPIVVQ